MKPHALYAIIAKNSLDNWHIVGLWSEDTGHFPCVNSDKKQIERLWELVDSNLKVNGQAKIAKFVEELNEEGH